MANRGPQISHVREYYCQYTNQLHKKQKSWHDGKLKYYQLNQKFQLYTIEGGVLLSSGFITNLQRLEYILDDSGFNKEEHKIFSQFLVIIDCLQCEYDRDVSGLANDSSTAYNLKKYSEDGAGAVGVSKVSCKVRTQKSKLPSHHDSLALVFNKPFRRPRINKGAQGRVEKIGEKEGVAEKVGQPRSSKRDPGNVSLALDMSRAAVAGRNCTQDRLRMEMTPITQQNVPREKPQAALAIASPRECDKIPRRQIIETTSARHIDKKPPTREEVVAKTMQSQATRHNDAGFRIHKKSITITHQPINLG
ncbi:LANO_0D09208g1_1 [Lachancea nothofagi CBS 11611]|uniref:LANO_0D09208g1_1 n=1 Tax=Lachancea nothofagi CBS 11611 TaxID=1266666 RepID=A0A1G4JJ93_9SACH|nr:LANO_0D09208g1_1 [Lachancea nothofagi CBS 11611]